jgi:hypothetical protein
MLIPSLRACQTSPIRPMPGDTQRDRAPFRLRFLAQRPTPPLAVAAPLRLPIDRSPPPPRASHPEHPDTLRPSVLSSPHPPRADRPSDFGPVGSRRAARRSRAVYGGFTPSSASFSGMATDAYPSVVGFRSHCFVSPADCGPRSGCGRLRDRPPGVSAALAHLRPDMNVATLPLRFGIHD